MIKVSFVGSFVLMALTEAQAALYVGILTLVGVIFAPMIVEWIKSKREKKTSQNTSHTQAIQDNAAVKIATIQADAATESELWTEVRYLRKDYNGLSLAYAQSQKLLAEQGGEVRYMKLQIGTMEAEIKELRAQLIMNQQLLNETSRELELTKKLLGETQAERDLIRQQLTGRINELEHESKAKAEQIAHLELENKTKGTTLDTQAAQILALQQRLGEPNGQETP